MPELAQNLRNKRSIVIIPFTDRLRYVAGVSVIESALSLILSHK